MNEHPTPIACVPEAIPRDRRARHGALRHRLFADACLEQVDLPAGYAFRFPASESSALAEWVDGERKCCPFLRFEMRESEDGALWLRVEGPAGSRAVIEAELINWRR